MDIKFYLLIAFVVFLIVALAIASNAGASFYETFKKYDKIHNSHGYLAQEFVYDIIIKLQIYNINVFRIKGKLTDAFVAKKNAVLISDSCYDNPSVAALAIVSHELGHAVQYNKNPKLFSVLNLLAYFNKFLSWTIFPLLISGLIIIFLFKAYFDIGLILLIVGCAILLLCFVYRILNINVEYGASKIAVNFLKEYKVLTNKEIRYAKSIMKKAALTYVATFFADMLYWTMLIKKPKKIK